jgi:hypothetical protein
MEKWQSKQCALKTVEKIISIIKEPDALEYWNEVKKEINNI